MIGPLLKNYFRLKFVGFILNLFLGRKGNVLKGTAKVTLLTFILEEIFNNKSKKRIPHKAHPSYKNVKQKK